MEDKESGWAWCVVAASFIVHLIVCGVSYSCGIFHRIFLEHNGASHFATAWISALLLAFTALGGIPGYLITYQFGYRVAVICGGLLSAVGLALGALAGHLYEFYLTVGVLTGLGFGIALSPAIMVIEVYFYQKRTLATNLAISGANIGMFLLPLVVYKLEEVFAWKGMCLVLAGLCLNICLCGACLRQNDVSTRRKDLLKMFELSLLKSGAFIGLIWSNFVWSFGISIIYTNLPDYVVFSGLTTEDGATLIAFAGLSAFASRTMFVVFSLSAKLDHVSTFVCTVCLATILTGLFPQFFKNKAGEIGYAIILGMHSGYWTTFLPHVIQELIGEEYIARGKGTVCLSVGLGLLAGPPVSGWLFDQEGDFQICFYLAGACLLLSSIVMMIVNLRRCHLRPVTDWSESDTESCGNASRLSSQSEEGQLIVSTLTSI